MPFVSAPYDASTIALMTKAYDAVIGEMKAADVDLPPEATRAVARSILEAVASGERDLNWLIFKGFDAANAFLG